MDGRDRDRTVVMHRADQPNLPWSGARLQGRPTSGARDRGPSSVRPGGSMIGGGNAAGATPTVPGTWSGTPSPGSGPAARGRRRTPAAGCGPGRAPSEGRGAARFGRGGTTQMTPTAHPVQPSVAYPARPLDRLTTVSRVLTVIPILIVLGTVSAAPWQVGNGTVVGGLLWLGPLLMVRLRQKYPRWWFDWNREPLRLSNRVAPTSCSSTTATRRPTRSSRFAWTSPTRTCPTTSTDSYPWPSGCWPCPATWCSSSSTSPPWWWSWPGSRSCFRTRYPRGRFDLLQGVSRWHDRLLAYAFPARHRPLPILPAGPVAGPAGPTRPIPARGGHRAGTPVAGTGAAAWPRSRSIPRSFCRPETGRAPPRNECI
jgi:hypothetical protein